MKTKIIFTSFIVLVIAVVGVVLYFISRPPQRQELLPQTFAQLPEKPKFIAGFYHWASMDSDVIVPEDLSVIDIDTTPIYSVAFSPVDASLIASVNGSGTINLWNINNTKEPVKILSHPGKYPSIGFSPKGELLVSAAWELVLWDVASGMKLNSLKTQYGQFAFSPGGHQLATVWDEVKLWDIRNPKKITEITTLPFNETDRAKQWACAVGISPDGKWIATGYSHGTINVWDLETKQLIKTLETSFYNMDYLKFSPNNKYMVSGGDERDMYRSSSVKGYIMWELPSWQRKGEVLRGNVENLVFSPDGKICATVNRWTLLGRGVELWSAANGAPITSLPIEINAAAFSQDGSMIAFGAEQSIVGGYKLTPQQLKLATAPDDVVRMIYLLPSDKEPPLNIIGQLDKSIKEVQNFYADEMERHGFGRKTFTFETDETGKAKVYLVTVNRIQESDPLKPHLMNRSQFDLLNDIWLAVEDDSLERYSYPFYKSGHNETFKYPTKRIGKNRNRGRDIEGLTHGRLITSSVEDLKRESLAYIFRDAFGLPYHPPQYEPKALKRFFSRVNNMMPWGKKWAKLSKCEAGWLDKSRFFNPNQPFFDKRPNIELNISKSDTSDLRFFQFTLEDGDGIHQAQLFIPIDIKRQGWRKKFHDCQALNGQVKSTVVFKITDPEIHNVELRMIDMHGNIASREF